MNSSDWMPKGGAKELRESSDGRKYLESLQKKHEIDLLQPGNPKFEQVYGEKIRKQEETRQNIARESQDLYKIQGEKRDYEKFSKEHIKKFL